MIIELSQTFNIDGVDVHARVFVLSEHSAEWNQHRRGRFRGTKWEHTFSHVQIAPEHAHYADPVDVHDEAQGWIESTHGQDACDREAEKHE